MRKTTTPNASAVDRTPSVWFMRLETAIRDKDVERALHAQRRLTQLGFDVQVIDRTAVPP